MKQVVMIDTKTKAGKSIAALLSTLSEKNKSITFLTEKELEEKEDEALGKLMLKSRTGRKASKKKVYKFLGIEK